MERSSDSRVCRPKTDGQSAQRMRGDLAGGLDDRHQNRGGLSVPERYRGLVRGRHRFDHAGSHAQMRAARAPPSHTFESARTNMGPADRRNLARLVKIIIRGGAVLAIRGGWLGNEARLSRVSPQAIRADSPQKSPRRGA